jgi:ribonuclease HII
MKNLKFNKSFQSAQFAHEMSAWENDYLVIGADEAGRGSLFGPVVAAAVILRPFTKNSELKDSKLLSPQQRIKLYNWLKENSSFATQITNHRDIDKYNIYQASRLAMQRAIINLVHQVGLEPKLILTDAMPLKFDNNILTQVPVIHAPKGEYWSASIAAASIVAKVTRDLLLDKLASINPCYNLAKNKGYGTAEHREMILKHGKSFLHRQTFNLKEENHG